MRSVVFLDLANTLVSGMEPSFRRELGRRLALTEKEVKRAGRVVMTHPARDPQSLAAALASVLPAVGSGPLLEAVREIWRIQEHSVHELDGASRLFSILRERGYALGVISNACHAAHEGFLRACPHLARLVEYPFFSYLAGCKKPSLDLFREAIRAAGVPAARCWMVGDTWELDVGPASRVGMRTVWLLSDPRRESQVLEEMLRGKIPSPDHRADTLDEVCGFFMNQGG